MPNVVGIRFSQASKVYFFDPTGFEDLAVGDYVIVDTARGREMGVVAMAPHEVPETEIVGKLKRIVRRVGPWERVQAESFAEKEREAIAICKSLVAQQDLPMKLVRAEYSFDGSRLTFYFTSDKRVDFRNLVRELAKTFRTRIELRQVGVRDEAKLIGGLGRCGRPLCCGTWLCEFIPVSIKMAKQQDLPLNPMEISGICGRLLCCLSYENDIYAEIKRKLPKVGRTVITRQGKGKIISHNIFKETMRVMLENEVIIEVGFDDLLDKLPEKPAEEPLPEAPAPQMEHAPPPTPSTSRRRRKKKKGAHSGGPQSPQ